MGWAVVAGWNAPETKKIADTMKLVCQYDDNWTAIEDEHQQTLPVKSSQEAIEAMNVATINQMRGADGLNYDKTVSEIGTIDGTLLQNKQLYDDAIASQNAIDARKAELETVEADATFLTENFSKLTGGALSEALVAELQALFNEFVAKKADLTATLTAIDAEIKSYDEKILAVYKDFAGAPKKDEPAEDPDAEAEDATVYNKYDVADNTVVYERFSNGRELVLNFNNFDINVTVNGKSYFVAAYDYIIIK